MKFLGMLLITAVSILPQRVLRVLAFYYNIIQRSAILFSAAYQTTPAAPEQTIVLKMY